MGNIGQTLKNIPGKWSLWADSFQNLILRDHFLFGGLAIKILRLSQAGELIELTWSFHNQCGNADEIQS